jgi:hypothetical protein
LRIKVYETEGPFADDGALKGAGTIGFGAGEPIGDFAELRFGELAGGKRTFETAKGDGGAGDADEFGDEHGFVAEGGGEGEAIADGCKGGLTVSFGDEVDGLVMEELGEDFDRGNVSGEYTSVEGVAREGEWVTAFGELQGGVEGLESGGVVADISADSAEGLGSDGFAAFGELELRLIFI